MAKIVNTIKSNKGKKNIKLNLDNPSLAAGWRGLRRMQQEFIRE